MPRGDRTGPAGRGPRSGRAAGFCAGSDAPGFGTAGGGFGRRLGGFGRGGGWGLRHGFHAGWLPGWMRFGGWTGSPEAEKETLEQEARALESSLEQIRRRLGEIGRRTESPSR